MALPTTVISEYFAASNGFDGFKSCFNLIFNPREYTCIYILKGGPGTGKSSMMRYICSALTNRCENIDMIYCSSDIKSLDGIIIKHNDKKIAVIDGTAPHMTDPKYPGAVERIINLAEAWNESQLKSHRERIIKISDLKQKSYDSAYRYLKICKSIDENVENIISKIFTDNCEETIKKLTASIEKCTFNKKEKLIEAFGCAGFQRIKAPECKYTYHVVGVYGSERIFYRNIIKFLEKECISYERYPFVLKNDDNIGIFIPDLDTNIINLNGSIGDENNIIDTSHFLNQTELTKEKNRLEFLWREREIMLWNSVSEFKAAANYHFELEKMYTSTMNFAKIDKIKDRLLSRITRVLQIKD